MFGIRTWTTQQSVDPCRVAATLWAERFRRAVQGVQHASAVGDDALVHDSDVPWTQVVVEGPDGQQEPLRGDRAEPTARTRR